MSDENATPLDDEQPTAADSAPLNADAIDEGVAAQDEGGAGPGAGGLALLAMALLVLAGGAVYLLGSVMSADSDTADAQAAAEEQIAQFDPNEFESNFTEEDLAPIDSIPLADDETDSTAGSSDSSDTAESSVSTTTTVAPFEGIDPSTVGLIFVNRVPGEDYGKVGYIDRNAERHIVDLECVRIDWNVNGGLCLDHGTSVSPGTGYLLAPDLEPTTRFDLSLPSRTAVSPNGGVMAWTGFTLGHSYLNPGEFATITQLISVERETGRNLEEVWETYLPTGELLSSEDQNYWGVTFIDDERFYATVGHSGTTDIVEGSLLDPRLEVVLRELDQRGVIANHGPPVGRRRLDAHAQKAERRDGEKDKAEAQAEFSHQRWQNVGQDFFAHDPSQALATQLRSFDVLHDHDIQRNGARQAEYSRRVEQRDYDDQRRNRRPED